MLNNNTNKPSTKAVAKQRPALDPRAPMLAQPFKRLVEEGFISELSVKFTPTGVTVHGIPDRRLCEVQDSGLTIDVPYPVGMLSAVADKGNLIPKGKSSKVKTGKPASQPLPSKTLVPSDFDGTQAELQARANTVAQNCGGATLVGRVRSGDKFDGSVTTSFQNWWQHANPLSRAHALMQTKFIVPAGRERLAKLGSLNCPFRGTAEFTVSSSTEVDDPEIPSTSPTGPRTPPQLPGSPPKTK